MRSFRKLIAPLAFGLASLSALSAPDDHASTQAKDQTPATATTGKGAPAKDGQKDRPAGGKDADGKEKKKGRISLPLVPNQPSKGLKIPYYDGQGKLQMNFLIGVASRLDEDRVEMSELRVQSFDDNGDPDLDIDFPASIFNLETHVLKSDTRTTIKRQDFEISGDAVEFNTDTKESELNGHVRMLIYNLNDAVNSKTDDTQDRAQAPK